MTVHGAKGLEAPIVILADAATTDRGRFHQSVILRDTSPGPFLVHASSNEQHVADTRALKELRKEASTEEYWRLLYVAMTRAEDELYITGMLTKRGKLEGSWYEAIEQAIGTDSETVTGADGGVSLVYPARPSHGAVPAIAEPPAEALTRSLPSLPSYQLPRIIRPSRAGSLVRGASSIEPDAERVLDTAVEALVPRDPDQARREGLALHALLQHLSRFPVERRATLARGAMPALLPDSPDRHAVLAGKALSILGRPELAVLFGPDSRAELPILAHGTRNGAPITIAGRIDRLVVEPDKVRIVDYKSDSTAPADARQVPGSYRTQLGLYALVAHKLFPGRSIEANILWTGPELLMNLPIAELFQAVEAITLL
jgi:ATP-dependent helicase/nuclease subunit A